MEQEVIEALKQKHVRVKSNWVSQCLAFLRSGSAKPTTVATAIAYVWEQYLVADIRLSSEPVLQPQHLSMHKQNLAGPVVLQVNEIVNVAEPLERRYEQSQGGKRMLKLHLSDGVNAIVAAELEHVPQLNIDLLAGCKVEISRVKMLQGMMMLTASSIKVLGGYVEQLVELANKTRMEVKRGLLPKEWMEELKDSIVSEAPASAMNILGSSSHQTAPPPVAPKPNAVSSALMPQRTPLTAPGTRKPPLSREASTSSISPARPMTTLDLTDSPGDLENGTNVTDISRQFGFIEEDDGIDFNMIEAALKGVQSPRANPTFAAPQCPQTNQFPSAAVSKKAPTKDYDEDPILLNDIPEEDEEILRIVHAEMEDFEPPPSRKPQSVFKPSSAPTAPPLLVNREVDEKGSNSLTSTEDIYKSFKRPASLLAPSQKSGDLETRTPFNSSVPPKPPFHIQEPTDDDDAFDRGSFNNVTPRSHKRLKKLDGCALKRINLDEIPESPPPIHDVNLPPPQPSTLPSPELKPQTTLIEIQDSPAPIRKKGTRINDFFVPKSGLLLQPPKRAEPRIIDMVDEEELPDDVPRIGVKSKSPEIDQMEIVPEFEVETFVPAVPLTSPLQSILKRTEMKISPPIVASKPSPSVRSYHVEDK